MDPVLVAVLAAAAAGVIGFFLGRSQGRASGMAIGATEGRNEGLRKGLAEGEEKGREEGRKAGLNEGRQAGAKQGRKEGRAQGLKEGREEGRRSGFDQGKAQGLGEGKKAGLEEGRRLGFEDGRRTGREEGRAEAADSVRGHERDAAMREAVSRVSAYLSKAVRTPLEGAEAEADSDELRERISRALGALQDLDYFIEDIEEQREGADLVKLAQGVAREFAADQDIAVRISLGAAAVHADVNPPALMDALYLLLHNAGRFGQGATIDLSVLSENGSSVVRIRDRGQGFSEEAFRRAFDPFYSTSDEGLGLGLPHARKVVEGMGGAIELRNVPDGGAEVELSFPSR